MLPAVGTLVEAIALYEESRDICARTVGKESDVCLLREFLSLPLYFFLVFVFMIVLPRICLRIYNSMNNPNESHPRFDRHSRPSAQAQTPRVSLSFITYQKSRGPISPHI